MVQSCHPEYHCFRVNDVTHSHSVVSTMEQTIVYICVVTIMIVTQSSPVRGLPDKIAIMYVKTFEG